MIEHSTTAHSTINIIKCKICNKEFHFVDLETHMKTHVDPSETSAPPTYSKSPKMIRINSKGELASSRDLKDVDIAAKTAKHEDLILNDAEIAVKPKPIDKTILLCAICKKYVLHKDLMIHNQKHDHERTSKLVQNIQNGRKRGDTLDEIRSSKADTIKDGNSFKGTKLFLKRKAEENNSQVEKRIKLENCS
jgi:hypothetical protein